MFNHSITLSQIVCFITWILGTKLAQYFDGSGRAMKQTILRQSIFNGVLGNLFVNKRFLVVGIFLGIIVTFAVIVGSPAIGGFDAMR